MSALLFRCLVSERESCTCGPPTSGKTFAMRLKASRIAFLLKTKTAPPATGGAVPSGSSDDASENVPNLRSADGAERRLTRLRGGTPPLAHDTVRCGVDRLRLLLNTPPAFRLPPLHLPLS